MVTSLRLAFLITCHNRRELTLRALRCVAAAAANAPISTTVVLLDDASTDGTRQAVNTEFPDTIIVEGDGNNFWNGGLYRAWDRARSLDVDAVVWLNDDVALRPDALSQTLACWNEALTKKPDNMFILAGATTGPDGEFTYGGKRLDHTPWALRFQEIFPTGRLEPIESFNGNFVVVPREVEQRIGLNDPFFYHNLGDMDYGLRATKAGVSALLLPEAIGSCSINIQKIRAGFGYPELSLIQQWKIVTTHYGLPFSSWARMTLRHSGIWFPLHFLLPYRRLVIPRWLNRLLLGKR